MGEAKKDGWVPRVAGNVDWGSASLTPEDMFVLSRVDGATNVDNLVHLTGLSRDALVGALDRLSQAGALEAKPQPGEFDDVPDTDPEAVPAGMDSTQGDATEERPTIPPETSSAVGRQDEEAQPAVAADGEDSDEVEDGEEAVDPLPPEAELRTLAAEEANHRKLYEMVLRPLTKDQRLALAKTEKGNSLLALCLDPDAQVIAAVMENDEVGLPHARLIAFHHRTATGLEALAKRSNFLVHREVQRLLVANPMLGEGLFNRILGKRRLKDLHQVVISRDVPEKTKVRARGLLRTKFPVRDPEERVELIMSTEGRCLQHLIGITLETKTVTLLSRRQLQSTLLITNLARFPGTPAALISILLKQPLVLRSPGLKNALLQHPNTPSDAKRRGGTA